MSDEEREARLERLLVAVQKLLSETVWIASSEVEPEEEYVYADDIRAIFAGTPPGGFPRWRPTSSGDDDGRWADDGGRQ